MQVLNLDSQRQWLISGQSPGMGVGFRACTWREIACMQMRFVNLVFVECQHCCSYSLQ